MSCNCTECSYEKCGNVLPTPDVRGVGVPAALHELTQSIERLTDTVNDLHIRLYPVLHPTAEPEPEKQTDGAKLPSYSAPMVRDLWVNIELIDIQREILKDIIDRLEI